MDEPFESEEQKKIYSMILKYPMLYRTKIALLLDMNISIVEQLLDNLEKKGLIVSTEEEGLKKYYVKDKKNQLDQSRMVQSQQKIYELIQKNPGLHLSKISELMNMRLSLAQYHLLNLEHDNLIISVTEGGYKRYYVKDSTIGTEEKKLLALLRQEIPLKIVLFLLKKTTAKHKEIMEHLGISPSNLSYHLNRLVKYEIIEVKSYGDEKGYKLKNKKEVLQCLLNYIVIDGFKDLWDDFRIV